MKPSHVSILLYKTASLINSVNLDYPDSGIMFVNAFTEGWLHGGLEVHVTLDQGETHPTGLMVKIDMEGVRLFVKKEGKWVGDGIVSWSLPEPKLTELLEKVFDTAVDSVLDILDSHSRGIELPKHRGGGDGQAE
ncbi:MAG: hypothetical protein HQL56_05650 [Magnetococcales bacterium]|nr:hypothetical protein [Magnetococcales bacterium]